METGGEKVVRSTRRQTRSRSAGKADGAREPERPRAASAARGAIDALVRSDYPVYSVALQQRAERGIQQQDQADPADGGWSTPCPQEAKAPPRLVWRARAPCLDDG